MLHHQQHSSTGLIALNIALNIAHIISDVQGEQKIAGMEGFTGTIHRNLSPSALYEEALMKEPGTVISSTGALAAFSGDKTGRFVSCTPSCAGQHSRRCRRRRCSSHAPARATCGSLSNRAQCLRLCCRCPKDKRIVAHPKSKANVWWGTGSPNMPLSAESFARNKALATDFFASRDDVYVVDGMVNWGEEVRARRACICM